MVTAVILPPRDRISDAIVEASRAIRPPQSKLYTDGHRVGWLPRPLPGWFRIGAADLQDDYERTDATAGCCDVGMVA